MAGALAANQQEHPPAVNGCRYGKPGRRAAAGVAAQGSRACAAMWTAPGLCCGGQLEAPCWTCNQRWQQRLTLNWWPGPGRATGPRPRGPAGRRLAAPPPPPPRPGPRRTDGMLPADPARLGFSRAPPSSAMPASEPGIAGSAALELTELAAGVDLHVDESSGERRQGAGAGVALWWARAGEEQRNRHSRGPAGHSASTVPAFQPSPCLGPCRRDRRGRGLAVVALPPPTSGCWATTVGTRELRDRWRRPPNFSGAGRDCWQFGGDNVQDPWFPGGDFDPLELFAAVGEQPPPPSPHATQGLMPFTTAAAS